MMLTPRTAATNYDFESPPVTLSAEAAMRLTKPFVLLFCTAWMLTVAAPAQSQGLAVKDPANGTTSASSSLIRDEFLPGAVAQTPSTSFDAYEAAEKKRARGRNLIIVGAALVAGGLALAVKEANSGFENCDLTYGCEVSWRKGMLVYLAGFGVGAWGIIEFRAAGRDIAQLDAQRKPTGGLALAFPMSEHGSLNLNVGNRSTLAYRVGW